MTKCCGDDGQPVVHACCWGTDCADHGRLECDFCEEPLDETGEAGR